MRSFIRIFDASAGVIQDFFQIIGILERIACSMLSRLFLKMDIASKTFFRFVCRIPSIMLEGVDAKREVELNPVPPAQPRRRAVIVRADASRKGRWLVMQHPSCVAASNQTG